jgi:hypothetical protein
VKLRDSIISCLQQEIAVLRSNKGKDTRSLTTLLAHLCLVPRPTDAVAKKQTPELILAIAATCALPEQPG